MTISHHRRDIAARLQRFAAQPVAGGVALMVGAAVALALANSPLAAAVDAFWRTEVLFGLPGMLPTVDRHFLVNDVAMVAFFFVVGLEIRRELNGGTLRKARFAALPILAGLGGMFVPAALFIAMAGQTAGASGWAVPMATDIAFAVGVLALLGHRVPRSLRMLLVAVAIVDDIGAIFIITVFYSDALQVGGLLLALAGGGGVVVLQRSDVRRPAAYLLPGAVVWAGLLLAGIHPSLAGVLMGVMTPASEGVRSPAARLHQLVNPYVALGVLPLFALANAGVPLALDLTDDGALAVAGGIGLGLVLGKPLGIVVASWVAVRSGVAELPPDVRMGGIAVVGLVSGVGFTMALFFAHLAFDGSLLAAAQLATLIASAVAALGAAALAMVVLPSPRRRPTYDSAWRQSPAASAG